MDLNADVAESFGRWRLGDDEAMLAVVTSANVACGFHAGDPTTLRRTCAMAASRGVVIGAQVSYRDLAGFGRRFIDVSADDLAADVLYQLGAVSAMCRSARTAVRYVKPHGALHAAVVAHEEQARAVVEAVAAYDSGLAVLGMPSSALLAAAARAGLRGVGEAFADRAYTSQGTLVPRDQPGAVLSDPEEVAERVRRLAEDGVVLAEDGSSVSVDAESVCVHGDSPRAVAMAHAVRERLTTAGRPPAPFVLD